MVKINYIIATWSGLRVKPADTLYYENILKNHLKTLSETKNNISQITIMKPRNDIENNYYAIELNDKIKVIECKNEYQSYGQWLKAVELYLNNFDYFIFIEDDYVPATDNFDSKLIDIYEEGTYLCSHISGSIDNNHCSISNGIISNNTIKKVICNIKFNKWFDEYAIKYPEFVFNGKNHQRSFSRYFGDNGIILTDYRKYYMTDYFANGIFTDYSDSNSLYNEKIFTPIQNIYK